jgi:hypothetical protein
MQLHHKPHSNTTYSSTRKLHSYLCPSRHIKMTVRPQVTQAPNPSAIFTPPEADPIPDRTADSAESSTDSTPKPGKGDPFTQPKLRLEIRDLDHPGASKFLSAINVSTVFSAAVKNVQRLLYRTPSEPHTTCPPTRSVTLILRDMGGVAYTTGVNFPFHFSFHSQPNLTNGPRPSLIPIIRRSTSRSPTSTGSTRHRD